MKSNKFGDELPGSEGKKAKQNLLSGKKKDKLLKGSSPRSLGDGDNVKWYDTLCFYLLTGFSFLVHRRFPISILQPRSVSLSPTHFTQNAFLSFIFFST